MIKAVFTMNILHSHRSRDCLSFRPCKTVQLDGQLTSRSKKISFAVPVRRGASKSDVTRAYLQVNAFIVSDPEKRNPPIDDITSLDDSGR